MTRRALLVSFAILVLSSSVAAEPLKAVAPPGADELLGHVRALTAPEMEGRGSGTPGGTLAGQYIADRLQAMGLRPGGEGGGFLQSFALSAVAAVGPASVLEKLGASAKPLLVNKDWRPHGGSLTGEVRGEVVFVGYGVAAAEHGYDDYAGIDVRGKVALALAGGPAHLSGPATSRLEKLIAARRRGATAMLIVDDQLPSVAGTGASVRLVSAAVTGAAADQFLDPAGKTVTGLRRALAGSRSPVSFATGVEARIRVDLQREERRTSNIIALLPGTDPARAGEAVVLGAHYDHLGRTDGRVHPGADDNASGTALVLALARTLVAAGGTPRTLVFALFSGEELGLLGSAHYTRHPVIPLDRTVAMLNFDMVGRMRERRLNVAGVESAVGLRALMTEAAASDPLALVMHDTPYAPSDQTSFYTAGVPVLFFFTDQHADYHTPGDTWDKINSDGMADVAKLALRIIERLGGEARPSYVKLLPPPTPQAGGVASGAAFLGVSASSGGDSDGARLSSVLPGTAAARAGLADGDVIVRLGDQPIGSFGDLRRVIADKRPGDVVSILYVRDGEDHTASVMLGAHP